MIHLYQYIVSVHSVQAARSSGESERHSQYIAKLYLSVWDRNAILCNVKLRDHPGVSKSREV